MLTLEEKINKYLKSDAGKEKVQARLHDLLQRGVEKTNVGSQIVSEKDIYKLVEAFRHILMDNVLDYDFSNTALSVVNHINNLYVGEPVLVNGHYEVELKFPGDLSRQSLYDDEYTGVENIVALFNNGYTASNYVYGWWEGHSRLKWLHQSAEWVRSRKDRPATYFMQNAVREFNAKYGRKYNVTVELAPIYEEAETYVNRTWHGDLSYQPSRSSRVE